MDLTLSLICQVFERAKNSPSVGTCSIVKGLGLEWTWTGQKTVQGHQNKVECLLTFTPPEGSATSVQWGFEISEGLYVECCWRE